MQRNYHKIESKNEPAGILQIIRSKITKNEYNIDKYIWKDIKDSAVTNKKERLRRTTI